ncbi:hypothetical protein ACQ4M3_20900 [Leptolyngbya sp. AN03gr2]|uniref:hypothetical protein n=1 Tax=unclassified Leptolyngbya TaxID=2650499 RepID=UPI003D3149CC
MKAPLLTKALLKAVCISGLTFAVAPSARSQDFQVQPVFDMTLLSGWTANGAALQSIEQLGNQVQGQSRPSRSSTQARSSNSAKSISFAYSPTPALKQKVVQGYVDRLNKTNPAASQAVSEAFQTGKYNYGQIYWNLIKDSGLRENDAADALSAYMILGYMVVNNVQDGNRVTVPMARGVRSQLAPLLSANSRLTAPGVPAQLGEEMKLQTVIIHASWQSAAKENTLSNYQQGIAAMFKDQYGLDLSQMKLTDRGFAKK